MERHREEMEQIQQLRQVISHLPIETSHLPSKNRKQTPFVEGNQRYPDYNAQWKIELPFNCQVDWIRHPKRQLSRKTWREASINCGLVDNWFIIMKVDSFNS